jgi:hypothetical protein
MTQVSAVIQRNMVTGPVGPRMNEGKKKTWAMVISDLW